MKYSFNLFICACILPILLPIILIIGAVVLIYDGRPIFYISERMKTPTRSFNLYKFRTMVSDENNSGVTGGDKSIRITRTGHFLRKMRLDELPQIFNVLRGDIGFIGPRPPLREFVDLFPETYQEVLKSKPGISGLASIFYSKHETRLLGSCVSATESTEVYCRRCVPRKAKIDLIYQRHQSVCFDLYLMALTIYVVVRNLKNKDFPS